MSPPQPFRIEVPDAVLADLQQRLAVSRLPADLPGAGWDYGTPASYLGPLVEHWRSNYDWRAEEAKLNRLPQYTATVKGFDVHFVHVRGAGPSPLPLLFLHGWPGSFWEVHKILGRLTDPAAHGANPADAFDVVAPSLPGYGFSPDPGKAGIDPAAMADVFDELMTGILGYPRYVSQGGDWGGIISSHLGYRHPDHVAGIHLNMAGARPDVSATAPPLTEEERAYLAGLGRWSRQEGAYAQLHATRPQTLAHALNDSPAGLAGWIVEKFRAWSDCGGDPERRFTKDELLTNVMIYWVTGSIASSIRLYREAPRGTILQLGPGEKVDVPTGYARFAVEIVRPPRSWVERIYHLTHWSDFERGGHFAALEEPDLLVSDIRQFCRALRSIARGQNEYP
jgi:pimeloyl-ACP methyl ester carboxylesterase